MNISKTASRFIYNNTQAQLFEAAFMLASGGLAQAHVGTRGGGSLSDLPWGERKFGDHDGDVSETKLTERQQKIISLIKESPTITAKQMSETLSVSQRTVERDLSALKEMDILKRKGKDNDGMWVI